MKQFDLGGLYIVPWQLTAWINEYQDRITIPDGSYVVILEIEEVRRQQINFYDSPEKSFIEYRIKILTTDGVIVHINSTPAGLNYWKPVQY